VHFHTVLFQYAENTPSDVIDKGLEQLRAMSVIPAVKAIAVGENMLDVRDGWTHGMTITFDSFDTMMREFGGHPMHLAVIEQVVPTFSRYLAMDVATS
jgi:hypothetical protein